MNPILLTDWLTVCARAGVAAIPATIGPAVRIDEIRRFVAGGERVPTLKAAWKWLEDNYRPGAAMWRWDCCGTESLKDAVRAGALEAPPELEFEPDDPRLAVVLDELERSGAEAVRVLVRPWMVPHVEAGLAVELRAFALGGGGVAVSNYHRRRPLPASYESVAREALALTEKLASSTGLPAFSADFLLSAAGTLFFLEGGPGFDRGRTVDACCFDAPPRPGEVALAPPSRQRG
jgi:hypothetical protein